MILFASISTLILHQFSMFSHYLYQADSLGGSLDVEAAGTHSRLVLLVVCF